MRALATGGTGFIGQHLVKALLAGGAEVRLVVRSRERGAELAALGAHIVEGDLLVRQDLDGALAGVDVVFHLAGLIQPTEGGPAAYRHANVDATANLLAACRGRSLSAFVHVSSVGAMGSLPRLPADEQTPCAPDNIYGVTKYEGETLARRASEEMGLPVVVVRPAWVYGPGDGRTLRLFAAIARRRFVRVGAGQTWLHPIYVGDVVDGLIRCAELSKAVGETYVLAGPEPVRLKQLVALVAELEGVSSPRLVLPHWVAWLGMATCEGACRLVGHRPPLYRRQLEFFLRDQLFSTVKVREELGFTPQTPLRDGLTRTLAWYREHGLLPLAPDRQ